MKIPKLKKGEVYLVFLYEGEENLSDDFVRSTICSSKIEVTELIEDRIGIESRFELSVIKKTEKKEMVIEEKREFICTLKD